MIMASSVIREKAYNLVRIEGSVLNGGSLVSGDINAPMQALLDERRGVFHRRYVHEVNVLQADCIANSPENGEASSEDGMVRINHRIVNRPDLVCVKNTTTDFGVTTRSRAGYLSRPGAAAGLNPSPLTLSDYTAADIVFILQEQMTQNNMRLSVRIDELTNRVEFVIPSACGLFLYPAFLFYFLGIRTNLSNYFSPVQNIGQALHRDVRRYCKGIVNSTNKSKKVRGDVLDRPYEKKMSANREIMVSYREALGIIPPDHHFTHMFKTVVKYLADDTSVERKSYFMIYRDGPEVLGRDLVNACAAYSSDITYLNDQEQPMFDTEVNDGHIRLFSPNVSKTDLEILIRPCPLLSDFVGRRPFTTIRLGSHPATVNPISYEVLLNREVMSFPFYVILRNTLAVRSQTENVLDTEEAHEDCFGVFVEKDKFIVSRKRFYVDPSLFNRLVLDVKNREGRPPPQNFYFRFLLGTNPVGLSM